MALFKNKFSARAALTLAAVFVLAGAFTVRLVDVQVIRAHELENQSFSERSRIRTIQGLRGEIVDRQAHVLAQSVVRYRIVVSPKNVEDFTKNQDGSSHRISLSESYQSIANILGISADALAETINQARAKNPNSEYLVIDPSVQISKEEELRKLGVPWLYAEKFYQRIYPDGAVAGNLLGYVGASQEAQAGLEMAHNQCLAGHDGKENYLSSPEGIPIPGSLRVIKEPKNGGELKLTIDSDLQWFVQKTLDQQSRSEDASWGVAIVLSVKTGQILALADYPSVDPNDVSATSPANRGSRAMSAPYEPGSIFKPITAAALIDAGAVNPNSWFRVPYHFVRPNVSVFDDAPHPNQNLTLTGILVASSNSGMSEASERIPVAERYQYLRRFGFGQEPDITFPGQTGGILGKYADWDPQTRYASSFGQGISASVVQLASAYQTLANHGLREPVKLVTGCRGAEDPAIKPDQPVQVVKPETAAQVTHMLEMVYEHSWMRKAWNIPGYRVAAKTGTAQISDGRGGYSKKYVVSVAGFAPATNPEFVVITSMFNTRQNTTMAVAPVFREVMAQALKKYRVLPSTTRPTELVWRPGY